MIQLLLAAAEKAPEGIMVPSPSHLADEHHLLLIIMVLILVIVLVSGGKGLGKLIDFLVKKLIGSHDVTVNFNEEGEATAPALGGRICKFSPDQCKEHRAEFERSQRNVQDIANLKQEFSEFKTAFFSKLNCIEQGVNEIKVSLAGTMAEIKVKLGQ